MDIISNYSKLPVGKFEQIRALCDNKELDDTDRHISILAILADTDERTIGNLPLAEFHRISRLSHFLEEETPQPHRKIANAYYLGGFCLVPTTDYTKLTASQYIDFQTFSQRKDVDYVELLAVCLIPKGHKYCEGYDIAEVQQAIRDHLSVTDVLTLAAFFLKSYVRLIRSSLNYSAKVARKMKDKTAKEQIRTMLQQVEDLLRSGDGLQM